MLVANHHKLIYEDRKEEVWTSVTSSVTKGVAGQGWPVVARGGQGRGRLGV